MKVLWIPASLIVAAVTYAGQPAPQAAPQSTGGCDAPQRAAPVQTRQICTQLVPRTIQVEERYTETIMVPQTVERVRMVPRTEMVEQQVECVTTCTPIGEPVPTTQSQPGSVCVDCQPAGVGADVQTGDTGPERPRCRLLQRLRERRNPQGI